MLERYPGRRGTATLRTLLLDARRSHAVYRGQRLIIELDGFATHSTQRAFRKDRARDRRLTACGWRTMRVTSPDLTAELAAELLSSLSA